MSEATVVAWRRYGNDRLYVTGADGTKLGWRDRATGADHCEISDRAGEFTAALASWVNQSAQTAQLPAPPPEAATESLSPPACADLAGRAAGAMARKQAKALKAAAPVRTVLARVLGVHTDERAWRLGADGEEKVAAQLAQLVKADPRWSCLHAVPVGERGSDIDHLVFGPGGVYTLNAKHHPHGDVWVGGHTVMVNGVRQPYVRNSRFEAARASKLLSAACGFPVVAVGVVVPVGADRLTVKEPPDDVHVVNRMSLVRWLRARPELLDQQQVSAVFEAARRSTTWASPPARRPSGAPR